MALSPAPPAAVPAEGSQQVAELGDLTLASGQVLRGCRIGYRTFGKLDARRSNTVLFPTWFGGTTANLTDLIGAGKLVDSTRYYVVAVDALANGVSSSPSNSASQPRMRYPEIGIRDMVESQHALLTRVLRIAHLRGVVGISMGGMQAFQWAMSYPDARDQMVTPDSALEFAVAAKARVLRLDTDCGHLVPSCERDKIAAALTDFLE
jgi:homoserine O-acetyltransferase